MDKNETLRMFQALSEDKGALGASIYTVLEEAFSTVMAKKFPEGAIISVKINQEPSQPLFATTRTWHVLEDETPIEEPEHQMYLSNAKQIDPSAKVDETISESLPEMPFNRIDVHQAKQLVSRLVREEKREMAAQAFERDQVHTLISAEVASSTPHRAIIDLGDELLEGVIYKKDMLSREFFHRGDCVKAYVLRVERDEKKPQVIMSRACPEMLKELFYLEVPEIQEGVIEIKSTAREPGFRSKIAVKSKDTRIDAIGACVGIRGARVQAVSNELNGERIDIIAWDEDPAHFVINALAPASPKSIDVDEERNIMNISVEEDQLAQVIGRGGQNIRLANQLTGWTLNVMSEADKMELDRIARQQTLEHLTKILDIDESIATVLLNHNYKRLSQVAQTKDTQLAKLDGFNLELAQEVSKRAKSALLKHTLSKKKVASHEPSEVLLKLGSLPAKMAYQLAEKGVTTRENLADLSVLELQDLIADLDDDKAASIIMEARAPLFVEAALDEAGDQTNK
jgi:transcription termination/antitermination protein NusA